MPALLPTNIVGKVDWLGFVKDRAANLASDVADQVHVSFAGFENEDHGGLTRASCSRVLSQYPRDTEIRNTRQICIVSVEELAVIAEKLGLDVLDPAWLGTSMIVSAIPNLSLLPPSSRLQMQGGATLTIDMENRPCNLPAQVIERLKPGHGNAFKVAAAGLRGVTAWVEREGVIRTGDSITLHVPDQDPWPHLAAVRTRA